MHLLPLSYYSRNSKNAPSTMRCAGSHNPQMLLPSLHWPTITMKKHQDQNDSRANSSTSTSATTYRLRMTGSLQEPTASRDNRRKMHCEMKNHDVDEVGSSAISADYWNLSRKEKFHCIRRLYSVLAVSLLNYDPTQHSSVSDKF
jgi:hypothetical protein